MRQCNTFHACVTVLDRFFVAIKAAEPDLPQDEVLKKAIEQAKASMTPASPAAVPAPATPVPAPAPAPEPAVPVDTDPMHTDEPAMVDAAAEATDMDTKQTKDDSMDTTAPLTIPGRTRCNSRSIRVMPFPQRASLLLITVVYLNTLTRQRPIKSKFVLEITWLLTRFFPARTVIHL